MKKLNAGNSSNGNNGNNRCTAFMLAKMTGEKKNLSPKGFSRYNQNVRSLITGFGYEDPSSYKILLKNFCKKHNISDPLYSLYEKTDLITILNMMEAHSKLIKESIGEVKDVYNDQRSAIRAFIDYMLHSYGLDTSQFTWKEALDVYQDYRNAA